MSPPVLELRRLSVCDPGRGLALVDQLSLTIFAGERVALVGESGCGKSLTALALLGLVPQPLAVEVEQLLVGGTEMRHATPAQWRQVRGPVIGLVMQEPATALHPVLSIGYQLIEAMRSHHPCTRQQARQQAIGLLAQLDLAEPAAVLRAYAHQLSGGQQQRCLLALALAGRPQLLIADEPTTALDVTTQAQVLGVLGRSCSPASDARALLLISHDLAVVASTVERVLVMLDGQIVEEAPVRQLFQQPLHPYTQALLAAVTAGITPGPPVAHPAPPGAGGCRFAARCPLVRPGCLERTPDLVEITTSRRLRCPEAPG